MMVDEKKDRLKILIIDNHAGLVKQIETRLSYEDDFEVCMVAPLDHLTESLLACKPNMLLIDPYYENSYKYDRIRLAMDLMPSLTVVVLTAVVDTALQLRLKKEGVHGILEKGLSSNELVDSLRQVMAERCDGVEDGVENPVP
jgi:DNA-binding NarL/FixJ family response regulator